MSGKGDPRVHLIMNVVLSFTFAYVVIWGLSFLGTLEFSWTTVAIATVFLALITHMIIS